jgi:hypothetical protein
MTTGSPLSRAMTRKMKQLFPDVFIPTTTGFEAQRNN